MKTEIEEYITKHKVCSGGIDYALTQNSMREVWDNCQRLGWLIWIIERQTDKPEKELRLFAVWCARQVQHLITDRRSIDALDIAERFANGRATMQDLAAARAAAWVGNRPAGINDAAAWAACHDNACETAWRAIRDIAEATQLKQFKLMIPNPFK
jgi:hypothetical protein